MDCSGLAKVSGSSQLLLHVWPPRPWACQEHLDGVTLWAVLPSVLPRAAADSKVSRDGTKVTGHTGTNPSHTYPPTFPVTSSFGSAARSSLDVSLDILWVWALVNKSGGEAPSRGSSEGCWSPGEPAGSAALLGGEGCSPCEPGEAPCPYRTPPARTGGLAPCPTASKPPPGQQGALGDLVTWNKCFDRSYRK